MKSNPESTNHSTLGLLRAALTEWLIKYGTEWVDWCTVLGITRRFGFALVEEAFIEIRFVSKMAMEVKQYRLTQKALDYINGH